ncbi:hypothetical protein N431DRAFT_435737 [Stipitochalara longipes BDJ]|nr:hypothetical protein N431DRAFT_435737 [Stipitochalara longipes BDJ]
MSQHVIRPRTPILAQLLRSAVRQISAANPTSQVIPFELTTSYAQANFRFRDLEGV